ncbi:MAG: hypothetical protein V3R94_01080, partial [Acidobacteriota bacterium]
KQRQFDKRLSSHDELISFLLNNLEEVQSEIPNLKAMMGREGVQHIEGHEGLRSPREIRLWALFRKRLKNRLVKHLGGIPRD